jgi:hypothetical protein
MSPDTSQPEICTRPPPAKESGENGPNELQALLRDAADRTDDAGIRRGLLRLLECGESASGETMAPSPPDERPIDPAPQKLRKRNRRRKLKPR